MQWLQGSVTSLEISCWRIKRGENSFLPSVFVSPAFWDPLSDEIAVIMRNYSNPTKRKTEPCAVKPQGYALGMRKNGSAEATVGGKQSRTNQDHTISAALRKINV